MRYLLFAFLLVGCSKMKNEEVVRQLNLCKENGYRTDIVFNWDGGIYSVNCRP